MDAVDILNSKPVICVMPDDDRLGEFRQEIANRQLNRRLKTIDAFQTVDNAYKYLIIYCNYLRIKPYTDCKNHRKHRNGSIPLQLCKSKINITD